MNSLYDIRVILTEKYREERMDWEGMNLIKNLRRNVAIFLLVGLVMLVGCSRPTAEFVVSSDDFKIRVLREQTFDVNYNYIFQTTERDSDRWRTIYYYQVDGPIELSDKQARIINPTTGYLTFGATYAVTSDAGKNWTFFNIRNNTEFGNKYPNEGWIREVVINENGEGKITLRPFKLPGYEIPVFSTTDYGHTWTEHPGRTRTND